MRRYLIRRIGREVDYAVIPKGKALKKTALTKAKGYKVVRAKSLKKAILKTYRFHEIKRKLRRKQKRR